MKPGTIGTMPCCVCMREGVNVGAAEQGTQGSFYPIARVGNERRHDPVEENQSHQQTSPSPHHKLPHDQRQGVDFVELSTGYQKQKPYIVVGHCIYNSRLTSRFVKGCIFLKKYWRRRLGRTENHNKQNHKPQTNLRNISIILVDVLYYV